jgi:hypothetical protein
MTFETYILFKKNVSLVFIVKGKFHPKTMFDSLVHCQQSSFQDMYISKYRQMMQNPSSKPYDAAFCSILKEIAAYIFWEDCLFPLYSFFLFIFCHLR